MALRPRRPPDGLVQVTPEHWDRFCAAVGANRFVRDLECDGTPIAWRAERVRFVDPAAYRAALGAWPPGYWPG